MALQTLKETGKGLINLERFNRINLTNNNVQQAWHVIDYYLSIAKQGVADAA